MPRIRQSVTHFKSNLLLILQTPMQMSNCAPCPRDWKRMLGSVHQGCSQCPCRQWVLRVTHAKMFSVTRPVVVLVTWTGCCVSVVIPVHKGVQDWLCSEAWGGWMCYLCGWKESALPNLQQNVLLKHILCVKSLKMSSKKTRVFKFNHSYILLH